MVYFILYYDYNNTTNKKITTVDAKFSVLL